MTSMMALMRKWSVKSTRLLLRTMFCYRLLCSHRRRLHVLFSVVSFSLVIYLCKHSLDVTDSSAANVHTVNHPTQATYATQRTHLSLRYGRFVSCVPCELSSVRCLRCVGWKLCLTPRPPPNPFTSLCCGVLQIVSPYRLNMLSGEQ